MAFNLESATERAEILRQADPVLNPLELGALFASYKDFKPLRKKFGIWASTPTLFRVISSYFQQDKVILAISGIAAGGKDAIREKLEESQPDLTFKAVTATSRAPREGEKHGTDYYFYADTSSFEGAIERGEFVESVRQGDRLYGMPKQSLLDAINRQEPVITTHVEMASGWPAIDTLVAEGFFGDKRVFPLKVFVLPNMHFSEYANEWLPERRDDADTRLLRASWEISEAAHRADLIITNTIRDDATPLEWQSSGLASVCGSLLDPTNEEIEGKFRPTSIPFEISMGITDPEDVIAYHKAMLPK